MQYQLSLVMRKPAFCICENKEAAQLRGNREADQHLCFRYTDSTIPLLPKSESSSLSPSSVAVQPPVYVGPGRKPRRPVFSQRGVIPIHVSSGADSSSTRWKIEPATTNCRISTLTDLWSLYFQAFGLGVLSAYPKSSQGRG